MSVPVLLFVLSIVAYLAFIVYSAKRDASDLEAPSAEAPGPLVSYGACCSAEGCKDYKDVDLEIAKADCENSGGVFKAFSACADEPCPKTETRKEAAPNKPKPAPNKPKPAPKKSAKTAKPKEAPKSSMKVARKNAKKPQRKKRDF